MAMRDSGIRSSAAIAPPTLTYASLTFLLGVVSEVDPAWLLALTVQVYLPGTLGVNAAPAAAAMFDPSLFHR